MDDSLNPGLQVHGTDIVWSPDAGTVHFGGLPSAIFWLDPSMLWMLAPMAEELGVPLLRLLIAFYSARGTDADYQGIIATDGRTLSAGFQAWFDAVAAAGWGRFSMTHLDLDAARARVVVRDPWELRMQRSLPAEARWGCPFLQGKLIGLFSQAFRTTCWAEEEADPGGAAVTFTIARSTRTIARELEQLRADRSDATRREFAALLAERTAELEATRRDLEALVARQSAQIQQLVAPILQVAASTLALPIIGKLHARRAEDIMQLLLAAIAERRARNVVLDVTGVDELEIEGAHLLGRIVRAVQLLGATCAICGVQPRVAQVLAREPHGLSEARVFADMQAALLALR
jgi:rsbT co-antagonist protein RsbR